MRISRSKMRESETRDSSYSIKEGRSGRQKAGLLQGTRIHEQKETNERSADVRKTVTSELVRLQKVRMEIRKFVDRIL